MNTIYFIYVWRHRGTHCSSPLSILFIYYHYYYHFTIYIYIIIIIIILFCFLFFFSFFLSFFSLFLFFFLSFSFFFTLFSFLADPPAQRTTLSLSPIQVPLSLSFSLSHVTPPTSSSLCCSMPSLSSLSLPASLSLSLLPPLSLLFFLYLLLSPW